MKRSSRKGMVHADTTEEVAVRAFHAICKIIANGLPPLGTVGNAEFENPSISRSLTEEEVKCAAQIAMWIEDPAKRVASGSRVAERELTSQLMKYTKFHTRRSAGQAQGVKTNQKKSKEAKGYYSEIIKCLLRTNSSLSNSDIAGRISAGQHTIQRSCTWLRNLTREIRMKKVDSD